MLEEVKAFLNFTWTDTSREKKIESYINSSKAYLNSVAGKEIDFDADLLARDLLFNRVLYMDSQALPDFNQNYSDMINELRIAYLVKKDEQTDSVQ